MAAALMVVEQLRKSDKPPFAWHERFPLELDMPSPPYLQQRGFVGFRPHAKVAELAAAERVAFTERLRSAGILDA
jgi:hypothetical protein